MFNYVLVYFSDTPRGFPGDILNPLGIHIRRQGHISVGVVGYPNTGKSSVINSMKRHSAVETGSPG